MTEKTDIDASLSSKPQQEFLLEIRSPSRIEDPQTGLEDKARVVWSKISQSEAFSEKYGHDPRQPGSVHCFLFSRQPRIDTFAFEAFAAVRSVNIMVEEMVYHQMFERVIEQNTKSRAKPNPVLMETRSTDFCYRLTILVEAIPQYQWIQLPQLRLVQEYAVLNYIWERFRMDLGNNLSPPDFLVGIPMPFEFVNVVGCPDYDFVDQQMHGMWHRGLYGEEIPMTKVIVPGTPRVMRSSLSYLSVEKLGPTIHYLLDLMKSQRRMISLSSALKIFDQLLCRLMVLHRYGVVMGNLDSKFLNFGVREATKVLYINRFDSATVSPTNMRAGAPYSDRCASLAALRRREVHFVNDIESAFYLFLSLIFPALPWDASVRPMTADSSTSTESFPTSLMSGKSAGVSIDEKVNFWSSPTWFDRMLHHVNFEFSDDIYQGFTIDMLSNLYMKTQEAMTHCSLISHADYMALLFAPSSPPNNAYNGIRRVIATYFRFERLSSITKDPLCQKKVELLLKEDPNDCRLLWNLNDWCWNAYCPNYGHRLQSLTPMIAS